VPLAASTPELIIKKEPMINRTKSKNLFKCIFHLDDMNYPYPQIRQIYYTKFLLF
jgi:hypothetical protein